MRVDTKPVETDSTRTLGKSGKFMFQTNLNYLDLGDILIYSKNQMKKKQTKKNPVKKTLKKKEQLAAKVSERMYDS